MRDPVKIIQRNDRLKNGYIIRFEIGMILSLLALISATKLNIQPSESEMVMEIERQEIVHIEEVVQTRQEIRVPAPPKPMIPIAVPNDEIIENEIINLDAELRLDDYIELPPAPPAMPDVDEEIEEEVFVVVEQMPELVGGLQSVQKLIRYPQMAVMAGIEGRVIVQFVIDQEGNVKDPVVVRGIGGGCDEEALRAVKQAKFIPGRQRGKPVQVRYSLPISFSLTDAQKN